MENWEQAGLQRANKIAEFVIIGITCFVIGFCSGNKKDNVTHPVEEIVNIDSLIKNNDSVKIIINDLDSIKDAKILEVQTLDNDSTLNLFYQLISK